MLNSISIQNFKSHRETALDLKPLTVFCGANGAGKSSVIQALLLLRDSFLNNNLQYLNLQAEATPLGTSQDVLHQNSGSHQISIGISTSQGALDCIYALPGRGRDTSKTIIPALPSASPPTNLEALKQESLFNASCQYISSARSGPLQLYPKNDRVVEVLKQISVMEGRAEHFIHYLYANRNLKVLQGLMRPGTEDTGLLDQVGAWEKALCHDIHIHIQDNGPLGHELKYAFDGEQGRTEQMAAGNVGFGLTYALPILVAILSAPRGGLLFIENPEAHLHPNAIAALTQLLCLAAQAGVQLIVETHSDHVINGILVNCKRFLQKELGLEIDKIAIYHFDREPRTHDTRAIPIPIESDGRIRTTQAGFFDQFMLDRKFLMGF